MNKINNIDKPDNVKVNVVVLQMILIANDAIGIRHVSSYRYRIFSISHHI